MSYQINDLSSLLRSNAYPGRGIVIGQSEDGANAIIIYFIMGRSANSRNRVFSESPGRDRLTIYPADETKVQDPSLIIYSPFRLYEDGGSSLENQKQIITNGDQTDTIFQFLKEGRSFEEALESRQFEPDAPNWTPRISGILDFSSGGSGFDRPDSQKTEVSAGQAGFLVGSAGYKLSILKAQDAEGQCCARYTFSYRMQPGLGHFLHTYQCDGNPIPSFSGEPERVRLGNDMDGLVSEIWDSLHPDNKISLYVRFTDLHTGSARSIVKNKYSS